MPLAVFCLTTAVFMPVLANGFVNWDDDLNFLENRHYRGLGWRQLRWMLTTFHGANYMPVTWMTSGLDYQIWGMEPFGYHLTSLTLHGINAVLYYVFVRRLFIRAGFADCNMYGLSLAALFSSLFFSIHPLRVEVVAWASARNHVVAGFFNLCTALAYLNYATLSDDHPKKSRWLLGTLFVYAMSLLSNGVGMTLPLVLVVLDVYPLRRLGTGAKKWFGRTVRRVWLEKLPFVLLAAAAAFLVMRAKQSTGATALWDDYGLGSRLAQACYGVGFYLVKTFLPQGLSPLYQLSEEFNPFDTAPIVAVFAVVVVTVCLYAAGRKWPAGLAAWICYIVILAPVSGIAQSGPQIAADRYSYLACLPWALLAGAGLNRLREWGRFNRSASLRLAVPAALGSLALAFFGLMSWGQAIVWRDSGSLWRHALTIDQRSTFAHNNLGSYLQDKGQLEEAKAHHLRALKIKPAYAEAHINLATVLGRQGRIEESTSHFQIGLQIDPTSWKGHYYLGVNFANLGDWQRAAEEFRESIRLDPDRSDVHVDLAKVLVRQGRVDQAIVHLEEAVRIKPEFADAHRALMKLRESKRADLKN